MYLMMALRSCHLYIVLESEEWESLKDITDKINKEKKINRKVTSWMYYDFLLLYFTKTDVEKL